ncbi:hypothetical protein CY34DRAFT_365312 [Suillus luteus UH-Slu-Lm8-n1]|uniref:Uncharacterized protein n=1 Tax=Suillus luteus UH-Slu-Lm8-n1 TaxID=930992 RepID=A0A0D0B4Y5_9AGAM|nr:hypothetical protein CY34DRAFT_365312 [Suillus luteus UH-Slu-Lm8-n1]
MYIVMAIRTVGPIHAELFTLSFSAAHSQTCSGHGRQTGRHVLKTIEFDLVSALVRYTPFGLSYCQILRCVVNCWLKLSASSPLRTSSKHDLDICNSCGAITD